MKKDSSAVMSDDQESESPSSDDEEDNDAMVVESLIAGRGRRSTAGNRLATLIDREADDELELLFAEDENDVEFEETDVEDQSDVQLESSDDDEDPGPPGDKADDDLAGEEELQKEARAERQTRKRKAQDQFFKPPALRKRVKIDPTTATAAPTSPAARLKKSERLSWMPNVSEGPTRASQRTLSVKNKEVIHERLAQSEKRRLRTLAMMEVASKRNSKAKKKTMTQEDRLAEAARTEKLNSKSLNRWEETEKKRAEEQKARLAALHDRRLEGPVITWWSGLAEWVNGKLSFVGRRKKPEPPADDESVVKGKGKGENGPQQGNPSITAPSAQEKSDVATPAQEPIQEATVEPVPSPEVPLQLAETLRSQEPAGFLDGIHYYASLPEHVQHPNVHPQPPPQPLFPPQKEIPPSPPKPVVEYSTRNLIILENFDPVAVNDRDVQRRILFKGKKFKAQKPIRELCVITSQPARFRDPATGLPYLNSYAYKEIQKAATNHCRWSSLLGCYVGPETVVARGVPERFHLRQDGPKSAKQSNVPDSTSSR